MPGDHLSAARRETIVAQGRSANEATKVQSNPSLQLASGSLSNAGPSPTSRQDDASVAITWGITSVHEITVQLENVWQIVQTPQYSRLLCGSTVSLA